MADWWQWSQKREKEALTFAVVGVGRFGTAVCRELISNGADVLAADYSEKAIDDLRQLEPSIEARVVDCTDEESMKESGILEMNTVVVGISEPIEASITTTLIAKDSEGSKVKRVIARATSDLHEKMLKRVGADKVILKAVGITVGSLLFVLLMAMLLSTTNTFVKKESFTFLEILFTCISAFATVGFDIGLTAKLNHFGQFILIVGMFVGRLGILLLLSALWQALYKSRIDRQKRIGYPKADLYV